MPESPKLTTSHKPNIAFVVTLIVLVGMICMILIVSLMLSNFFSRTPKPTLTPTPSITLTVVPVPTATVIMGDSCNNAIFVNDVTIPDGSELTPNQTFIKTWRVKNIGTCTWDITYSLVFIGGDNSLNSRNISIDNVTSGSEVDISVELIAPSDAGRYEGYWRLRGTQGNFFGPILGVFVEVKP